MNECLTTPQHKNKIGYWVSNKCTRSSTIFGGLIHQRANTNYEGVSKMSGKSMLEAVKNWSIRRPNVRMAFGLASNNFIYGNYLWSNTASCARCLGSDLILEAYCRDSFARLARLGSWSTYKLSIGEVLNAPRQNLRPCCVQDPASASWPII